MHTPPSRPQLKSFLLCGILTLVWSCANPVAPDGNGGLNIPEGAVRLTDYASYKNGNDWAPCFEIAFSESNFIYVPEGEYVCSTVNVPSGKIIQGSGAKTIFRPSGAKLFAIEGTCENGQPVAEAIPDFSSSITLKSIGKIVPGDDIMIISQRNCMLKEGVPGMNYDPDWVLGRTRQTSVFFGEFDTVQSVSGTDITTTHKRVFPSYHKDDSCEPAPPTDGYLSRKTTSVYRLHMVKNVVLKDFSVQGSARCYRVIALKYAGECTLKNISFNQSEPCFNPDGNENLTLIHAYLSRGIAVKSCSSTFSKAMVSHVNSLEKTYANFSRYNIFKIISCWDSGFDSCRSDCATHGFSITRGSSSVTSISGGRCYIRGCNSSNNIWSGVTVQQGVWNTELTGNEVSASGQGICCAGRCSVIKGNRLSTTLPHTTSYYYTHITTTQNGQSVMFGGTGGIVMNEGYSCGTPSFRSIVEGNNISGFYTAIAIRDGYEEKNIFEEGHITIRSNRGTGVKIGVGIFKNAYNTSSSDLDILAEDNDFGV